MSTPSEPSGKIPNVWDAGSDVFDHAQLAANWDAIDTELTRLDSERMPVGTVITWWRPSGSAVAIPNGTVWQPCDGRIVTSANHDFGTGSDITLPDLRNAFALGSTVPGDGGTPSVTYAGDGVAAPQAGGNPNASYGPGIGGRQGSMQALVVPNHHHLHAHVHEVGPVTNALFESGSGNNNEVLVASANQQAVPGPDHKHNIDLFSSQPRDPTDANKRDLSGLGDGLDNSQSDNVREQTSMQIPSTSGTTNVPLPASGPGGNLAMDGRPTSVGLLYLMKVKAAT